MLLSSLLILSACGGESAETGAPTEPADNEITTEEQSAQPVKYAGGDNEYRIIYPDKASDTVVSAAETLKKAIKSKTGADLEVRPDLIAPKAGYVDSPYEIVVGVTSRPESSVAADLRKNDYIITTSGTKIVIAGGCDKATSSAVNRFISSVLTKDGEMSGEPVVFSAEYKCASLKINGKDVSEYTIVYPRNQRSSYQASIDLITERIGDLCGAVLKAEAYSDNLPVPAILIGSCANAPAGKTLDVTEYSANSDGENVSVYSVDMFASAAVSAFIDRYFPKKSSGDLSVAIPAEPEIATIALTEDLAPGADFRIMTSNVLGGDTLSTRAPLLCGIFSGYLPDVIGLQECNDSGHSGIIGKLGGLYDSCARKIAGSTSTCYTPILYLKDRYTLLESGSDLFSSRWPRTNTKTYAWAVLERKTDGIIIIVINAHWSLILSTYDTVSEFGRKMTDSVEGVEWRRDNSRQILEKRATLLEKYGEKTPVFIMGDMNAKPTAQSVTMLETENMKNSAKIAKLENDSDMNSFHSSPGTAPSSGAPIDIIVTSSDLVTVYRHRVVRTADAIDASDHCPVYIDVSLN